jgi:hypothetical protein
LTNRKKSRNLNKPLFGWGATMTANTEITELIRSELCRFLQDACAGKTGVKLDMDNPAAEVSAPLGFVTG